MFTEPSNFEQHLAELHHVQTRAIDSLGHNIERVSAQLTGLTSAVYTQSVSQIVTTFDGTPSKFKEWIKSIEKYATLTNLGNGDISRIAFQSSTGPVGAFIKRYIDECRAQARDPDWQTLKKNLTSSFGEITDQHLAFAMLRKIKQKPNENVQMYSERLWGVIEDAYPNAGGLLKKRSSNNN